MSRNFKYIFLIIMIISAFEIQAQNKDKPRIAIVGIQGENSTFSPAKSDKFSVRRGGGLMDDYPFFDPDSSLIDKADWLPVLIGWAPDGKGTFEAYENVVSEAIEKLKDKQQLDGILFDIHGALVIEGMDDPEGDFISRIREAVGTGVLISTTMDLHGSVTRRLARNTDLITAFRMAPHEDRYRTKKRAINNLLDRLENNKGKPKYKAWVPVPILLPGEQTSTRIEPAKSLYKKIPKVIDKDKVIDATIWMSYPWADKPENHGVIVTYGDDKKAVGKAAEKLANYYWSVREDFDFVAKTVNFEDALKNALKSNKKPFIISDMGDNPGAGGSGDITWTLNELLKRSEFTSSSGKSWIYGMIKAPEFVKKAKEIGVGGEINAKAGASIDDRFSGPVQIDGEIAAINDNERGSQVAVKVGNGFAVFSESRSTFQQDEQFEALDLDPRNVDILIVKQGYLVPDLYEMRGDWVMALTPGGVDQDLLNLDYHRIRRPMFPLDSVMGDPDLHARYIPLSNQIKRK